MTVIGFYYLHQNGELIYKRDLGGTAADLRDSYFCKMFWPVDVEDRSSAWRLLVEATALGANPTRISELAEKWGCDDEDGQFYAGQFGVSLEYNPDADRWRASVPHVGKAGAGDNVLAALACLAVEVGYKPVKKWGPTFAGLVTALRNPKPFTQEREK